MSICPSTTAGPNGSCTHCTWGPAGQINDNRLAAVLQGQMWSPSRSRWSRTRRPGAGTAAAAAPAASAPGPAWPTHARASPGRSCAPACCPRTGKESHAYASSDNIYRDGERPLIAELLSSSAGRCPTNILLPQTTTSQLTFKPAPQ